MVKHMKNTFLTHLKSIEYLVIGFIFLVLFVLSVLFTRTDGEISWIYVIKIWKDLALLIPIYAINHWIFVPKVLFRRHYIPYFLCVIGLITVFTITYYYHDEVRNKKPKRRYDIENKRPDPIPPYAQLLMYSLLIIGVDTGLSFSKKWSEIEESRLTLEKKSMEMQLDILRNQISPHFFMNTLNNIYALIDNNNPAAKEAVMKLSKLMRYMLYENENAKVKLSKEFEFIRSYIDLMKLRFADEMTVHLIIPEIYEDIAIPPLLFITYIENAFKYGTSYQHECFISIIFEINDNKLQFNCNNTNYADTNKSQVGGIGLINNKNRLDLLFDKKYALTISPSEKMFYVS
jgi:hypothetical protein